jgi:hypothetical protein
VNLQFFAQFLIIKYHSSELKNKMIDLSKIAYLVPNLPRFDVLDLGAFWQWWDEVNIPIKRTAVDSRGYGGGYNGEFWDGVTIWQKEEYQKTIVWKVNHHRNDSMFGGLIDAVLSSLPWFDVQGLTLWSNKIKVGSHRDGRPRDPFPSAPRIMLVDECRDRTFYLEHQDPFEVFRPDLRQGPNLFYFNNENFMHGTLPPVEGRKVLIRVDGPLVDSDGFVRHLHEQLNADARYEMLSVKDGKGEIK